MKRQHIVKYSKYCLMLWFLAGCKLPQPVADAKLYHAVLTEDAKSVRKYLKKGADVNYQEDQRGWTPLLFAVEAEDLSMVRTLIDHGADVNRVSNQYQTSPLQRAASRGNLNIMKLLIEKGADLDHQDSKLRSTPLMWAAVNGRKEAARLLLDKGALVDVRANRGESALFLAVSAQQVEIVKLLLTYNAKADRPDIYGITPLQKANKLKNQEIIALLSP